MTALLRQPSRAFLIAFALIALAACGSDPTPVSGAPTGPPVDGGSYTAPDDIAAALEAGGLDCDGYRDLTSPDAAPNTGSCTAGGETVTIRIYSAGAELVGEKRALEQFPIEMSMLSGLNWSVTGDDGYIKDAQGILGGEITRSP